MVRKPYDLVTKNYKKTMKEYRLLRPLENVRFLSTASVEFFNKEFEPKWLLKRFIKNNWPETHLYICIGALFCLGAYKIVYGT